LASRQASTPVFAGEQKLALNFKKPLITKESSNETIDGGD
jgi:hypothetical protein